MPQAGANITFASIPNKYFKLVTIRNVFGSGPYTAQFQVSPDISISDAPADDVAFETRIRYSQVRLTGHDFLDIGTGNFADTNYPNTPVNAVDPTKETELAVEINENEGTIISSPEPKPYAINAACKAEVPEFRVKQ